MKKRSVIQFVAVVWLSLIGALTPSMAQEVEIEGYSPVSYFTKGIAEKGSPRFSSKYRGKTYHFTSQEQIDMFSADPEHFVPRFGAYCAYSLSLGMTQPIDPTRFKIVGDLLLLFHYSEGKDARAAWEKGDDQEQYDRATSGFTLLRF